jgi:hypothetical protein
MSATRHAVLLLSLGAPVVTACAYDFGDFDPVLDASIHDTKSPASDARDSTSPATDATRDHALDGGPPSDTASPDAHRDSGGCTAPSACYAQAGSCSSGCASTESTCASQIGCSLDPSCVPDCEDAEAMCKKGCTADCTACTADAGCIDLAGCTSASK